MPFPSTVRSSESTDCSKIHQQSVEITSMVIDDVEEILSIEKSSFPVSWSRDIFVRELQLPISRNCVAKIRTGQVIEIAGYVIYWLVVGEAQIHKIAVRENLRRSGIASGLMTEMLRRSCAEGAGVCTLEVGRSNKIARKLYEKFGFTVAEVRPGYYVESGDDALVMSVELKK